MTWRFANALGIAALCLSFAGCAKKTVAVKKDVDTKPQTVAEAPAPQREVARQESRAEARQTASAAAERRMPDEKTKVRIQDLLNKIQDAYFDYDKHEIRSDAQTALRDNASTLATILKDYPDYKLTMQGHCDERGSAEYNLGLGDARAKKAKEYMVSLGIPESQLMTTTFGKEKPVCTDPNEACYQKNRRAHLTQEQGTP